MVNAPVTIDWFTNNCKVLEETLAGDFSDPIGELVKAESWLNWIKGRDATYECVEHFYREFLPKLTKTLLNRKYTTNDAHIAKVTDFIIVLGEHLGERLELFPEHITKSLVVLFNPRQPFYDKYGFPKLPKVSSVEGTQNVPTAGSTAPVDTSWMEVLVEGECIDGKAPSGDWEIAIIDAVSPTGTELSVTWSTGVQEWLSIETSAHRIARFGSKSGVDPYGGAEPPSSSENTGAGAGSASDNGATGAGTDSGASLSTEEVLWRENLRAGDLIDARDKSGFWYQACIMEIMVVENTAASSANDTPVIDIADIDYDIEDTRGKDVLTTELEEVSILKDELFATKKNVYGESDASSSNEQVTLPPSSSSDPSDMEQSGDDLDVRTHGGEDVLVDEMGAILPPPPLVPDPAPPLPIPSHMHDGDDVVDAVDNNYATSDEHGMIVNDQGLNILNTAISDMVQNEAKSSDLKVTTTTFARVAFMGWLEWTDEWIDIKSDRIAKLNVMSYGQRGDFHVRDEVKYLTKYTESKFLDSLDIDETAPFMFGESANSVLVSPVFASVVHSFGMHRGFVNVCSILKSNGYNPNYATMEGMGGHSLSISTALELITALGQAGEVLTRRVLDEMIRAFETDLVSCGWNIIKVLMSSAELRSVATDVLEKVLEAISQIQLVMSPDPAVCASKVDTMYLFIVSNYIHSKFLNRRLGGLKMLTDIVNRSEAYLENPNGLKVTRSAGTTTSQSNATPTMQLASYTVVRACSFTPLALCNWINGADILTPLFVGSEAHSALMQRSADIIKFLSKYDCLQKDIITTLWDVGFKGKVPEALQVLQDLIAAALSVPNMTEVLDLLSFVPEERVSVAMTEILESMAIRCRELLMEIEPEEEASGDMPSSADGIESGVKRTPRAVKEEALLLHNKCLSTLWAWACGDSRVPDSISVKCNPKIESVLSLGVSNSVVCAARNRFPWEKQWERGLETLESAVQALKEKRSVSLAIKTIRSVVMVWLKDGSEVMPITAQDGSGTSVLPFGDFPLRRLVAEYMQEKYGLVDDIVGAVLFAKEKFTIASQSILSEVRCEHIDTPEMVRMSSSSSIAPSVDEADDVTVSMRLTADKYVELNQLVVEGSRSGYKDQLETCFDFIHFLLRGSPCIRVSFESVESIWKGILLRAITPQERDAVFSFVSRLILHRSSALPSNIGPADDGESGVTFFEPAAEEAKGGETATTASVSSAVTGLKELYRASFCSKETVLRIFEELLCNNSFVAGPQFNTTALACVEKFYRWVGGSNGSIFEMAGKDGTFMILKSLTSHTEWEIFPKIAMLCVDDKAAKDAIRFVTMFPQRLSPELMHAGDVMSLRQMMLRTCMTELEAVRNAAVMSQSDENDSHAVIGESKKLRRTLMLLHALIDESMADVGRRVPSHGGPWKSHSVTVKIQYNPKKIENPILTLDSNDSLEFLMEQVAAVVGKPLVELKMFRKGKEIQLGMFRRTLQQVDISVNEVILVADRPKVSSSSAAVATATPANATFGSYDCPVESLPSVIVSSTPEYMDLLFALLDICSGSLCDGIWGLILRLPTSPSVLRGWREVVTGESADEDSSRTPLCLFGLNSDGEDAAASDGGNTGKRFRVTKSLSRLLYNMQVVENMLHATPEKSVHDGDIVDGAGDDWVTMFIYMGGIPAIAQAMEFTASQVSKYLSLQHDDLCCCGVTTNLLLCAMGLATKMYRAFVLRSALCAHPESADRIQQLLLVFSQYSVSDSAGNNQTGNGKDGENVNATSGTSTSAPPAGGEEESKSSGAGVGDVGDVGAVLASEDKENCAPPGPPESASVKEEPVSDDAVAGSMPVQDLIVTREWGNKLDLYSDAAHDVIISSGTLTEVQSTVCKLLSLARIFSLENSFHMDFKENSSSVTSRSAVLNAQEECLDAVKNLYVIWTASVVIQPHILRFMQFRDVEKPDDMEMEMGHSADSASSDCTVDCTGLLASLLTGHEMIGIRGKNASPVRKTYLSAIVSMLSVYGLETVVSVCATSLQQSTHDEGGEISAADVAYTALMRSVIALRPSVDSTSSSATEDDKSHMSAESLFHFASKLIALRSSSTIICSLSVENIRSVCENILNEFSAVVERNSRWQKYVSGKYMLPSQMKHVDGTMQLLTNLAVGEPEICDYLLSSDLVNFVMFSCVGVVPKNNISLTTLCTDKASRKQAYDILRLCLTSRDFATAQGIFNGLTTAHRDVSIVDSWAFDPESSLRSSVGYVGLKNMGCTCYMNSLLQILYMMPRVREGVLQTSIDSADPEVLKDDLGYQLQVMFQHLQHSTRKAFSPDGWVFSYKDETGSAPVNVIQQQDAQEFLQVLCERVERRLLVTSSDGDGQSVPLLSEAFGGTLCDQMLKEGGGENSLREKSEAFVCISVDVRGTGGLEQSLHKFVEGETITDYLWEEDQPRVDITKRQCIGKLSSSVIFHLKRFELNFDTFLREKVNDEFTFPPALNMYPFSKEGLAGIRPEDSEHSAGYYQYELAAIVVHTGTTDSGHYFSYIRESAEDACERCRLLEEAGQILTDSTRARKWIEFNDSEVTPFSELRIASECYGGSTTMHDYTASNQTWSSNKVPNPKSAYMLVYNRVAPLTEAEEEKKEMPAETLAENVSPPENVVADNQTHMLSHRVFSGPHMDFMLSLEENLLNPEQFISAALDPMTSAADRVSVFKKNTEDFVEFMTTHAARSMHHSVFQQSCSHLATVLDRLMELEIRTIVSDSSVSSTPNLSQVPSTMSEGDMEIEPYPPPAQDTNVFGVMAPLLATEVASVILRTLLKNNGSTIQGIFFSPKKAVRGAFSDLLYKCFLVFFQSNPEELATELVSLDESIMKTGVMTPFSINDIPQIIEDSACSPERSPATELLLFLTRDAMFLVAAEQWRRAESFTRIFARIAPLHVGIRRFFIRRELVMQLVDLFVGDSSPCNGELYATGSRKRASTSYVSVVFTKEGKLPKSADYIPDWMDLLETLRCLVLSSVNNAMLRLPTMSPPSLAVPRAQAITLDPYSHRCINCKILYTHALRQARYCPLISDIIRHLSFDDMNWTNDAAEILVESISFAANDATGHYFQALEAFMQIEDNYGQHRANRVLDGPGGLLSLLKSCMVNKPTFVCICLFSVFKMALRVQTVFKQLSMTSSKVAEWAPWILKFTFQFGEKMKKEEIALNFENQAKSTVPADPATPPTKKKGPFLRIYGELEPEYEDTWVTRAAKTFELVQEVLRTMGESPDNLIPVDAFDDFTANDAAVISIPDDDAIPPGLVDVGTGGTSNVNGPSLPDSALGDAMTDEEFARFLAQTAENDLD